jgi:protein-arginine kinase activator protein McsA
MNQRYQCPECDRMDSERVHTEWYTDMVEEVRICNNCPTQFTNRYSLFEQEVDDV